MNHLQVHLKDKYSQGLLECILNVHQAALDITQWHAVFSYIVSYTKSGKCAITTRDNITGHVLINDYVLTITKNINNRFIDDYARRVYLFDQWTPIERAHQLGEICLFSDHLSKEDLKNSEYYKWWLKPQNITDGIAIQIFKSKNYRVVFNILFNENANEIDRLLHDLKILVPHFCIAITTWAKLSGYSDFAPAQHIEHWAKKEYRLTKREIDVSIALVRFRNRGIVAKHLGIELCTIKTHIKNINAKMGTSTSAEIINCFSSFYTGRN